MTLKQRLLVLVCALFAASAWPGCEGGPISDYPGVRDDDDGFPAAGEGKADAGLSGGEAPCPQPSDAGASDPDRASDGGVGEGDAMAPDAGASTAADSPRCPTDERPADAGQQLDAGTAR